MTTFQERLFGGTAHESAVVERFITGRPPPTVERFGQAMLPEHVREALRATGSPLRWLPDLLVVCHGRAFLVDAKAGRADTPNYSIEVAALMAHRQLERVGYDIAVVWHDFRWSAPRELHLDDGVPGTFTGNGSGTPFWMFRKVLSHPWAELVQ